MEVREQMHLTDGRPVWICGHQRSAKRLVLRIAERCPQPARGPVATAIIVPNSCEEWPYFAEKILPRLTWGGWIWLVHSEAEYPTENQDNKANQIWCTYCEDAAREMHWPVVDHVRLSGNFRAYAFVPKLEYVAPNDR